MFNKWSPNRQGWGGGLKLGEQREQRCRDMQPHGAVRGLQWFSITKARCANWVR